MPRYVVERTFSAGLNIPTTPDGALMCRSVVDNNSEVAVTWVHSYVSQDRSRTFCVYDGPDPSHPPGGHEQRPPGGPHHAGLRPRPVLLRLRGVPVMLKAAVAAALVAAGLGAGVAARPDIAPIGAHTQDSWR